MIHYIYKPKHIRKLFGATNLDTHSTQVKHIMNVLRHSDITYRKLLQTTTHLFRNKTHVEVVLICMYVPDNSGTHHMQFTCYHLLSTELISHPIHSSFITIVNPRRTCAVRITVYRLSKFCTPRSACVQPLCSWPWGATGVHPVTSFVLIGYEPTAKTTTVTLVRCFSQQHVRWWFSPRRWHSDTSY